MSKSWYFCLAGGDPTNVYNYQKTTVQHTFLCGSKISVILAEGIEKHPNSPLSNNIILYINKALETGQLQPDKPIGSKKYVYLRD